MNFSPILYKIRRRIRRMGEKYSPDLFFTEELPDIDIDRTFRNWVNLVPFDSDFNFNSHLTNDQQSLILRLANDICDHKFRILGSEEIIFSGDIDWHTDIKSGYRWSDAILYSEVSHVSQNGEDIKIPWEISRFHHGVTLALAWRLTENTKYSTEFFYQVQDWIDHNRVGFGVNWSCAMDISIRAINWLIAIALFNESFLRKSLPYKKKVTTSLWHHANFVNHHLEWLGPEADAGANHLLFDFAGLLTLGCFFKASQKGTQWFKFAREQVASQLERQVLSDGVHFECSTYYHRFCLEAFLWCKSIMGKNAEHIGKKISLMQKFVYDYTNQAGKACQMGDNDSGRLIKTGIGLDWDHSYLFPETTEGTFFLERYLLDGSESAAKQFLSASSSYPKAGFYFLRNSSIFLAIRAGRLAYKGTHAHNDQLSFELSIGNNGVFVDRGTYVYAANPKARNKYRATSAHNTLQVDGLEQSPLGLPFYGLKDNTNTEVVEANSTYLKAVHHGFLASSAVPNTVCREFALSSTNLTITDTVGCMEAGSNLQWYFHLEAGLKSEIESNTIRILKGNEPLCELQIGFNSSIYTRSFPHSPSYGMLEEARVIIVRSIPKQRTPMYPYNFTIDWT